MNVLRAFLWQLIALLPRTIRRVCVAQKSQRFGNLALASLRFTTGTISLTHHGAHLRQFGRTVLASRSILNLNKRNETNGLAFHMADLNSLVVLGVNLDYASDGLPPLPFALRGSLLYRTPLDGLMEVCAARVSQFVASCNLIAAIDGSGVAHFDSLSFRPRPTRSSSSPTVHTLGVRHTYVTAWRPAADHLVATQHSTPALLS